MRIGIDFDNTVICYDAVFHETACEMGLIPSDFPRGKERIRNHLRERGEEDRWTELQGFVYGVRIERAEPFDGVLDYLGYCRSSGIPVCIISHKTRHPYRGPRYDLHRSALAWLELRGFFDAGLTRDDVFLELTKEEKLARIAAQACTHFIDDLPEFLGEAAFPGTTVPILFDPHGVHAGGAPFHRAGSWREIPALIRTVSNAHT